MSLLRQENKGGGAERRVVMQNAIDKFKAEVRKELNIQSNADRIRAMSDEELAEFFSKRDKIPNTYKCKEVDDWIQWLQSEAE